MSVIIMLKRFSLIPDTKHHYPHTEGDCRAMCTATQQELFGHNPGNMTKVLRFNLASQFHTSPALECCWYGAGVDFMGFRVLSHDTLWHKGSVLKLRISAPTPLCLAVSFVMSVGLPDARAHSSIHITWYSRWRCACSWFASVKKRTKEEETT